MTRIRNGGLTDAPIYLATEQCASLRDVVTTYTIDLPDPVALEVLLVVDKILGSMGVSGALRAQIFGPRAVAALTEFMRDPEHHPAADADLLACWRMLQGCDTMTPRLNVP